MLFTPIIAVIYPGSLYEYEYNLRSTIIAINGFRSPPAVLLWVLKRFFSWLSDERLFNFQPVDQLQHRSSSSQFIYCFPLIMYTIVKKRWKLPETDVGSVLSLALSPETWSRMFTSKALWAVDLEREKVSTKFNEMTWFTMWARRNSSTG